MHNLTLATDSGGIPLRWVNHERVAYYKAKDLVLWEHGTDYSIYGGFNRIGKRSEMIIPSIIGLRFMYAGDRAFQTPRMTRGALFSRDRHTCAYCGNEFYEHNLSVDHIIPQSQNGEDSWKNCITACQLCNRRKGPRTPEQARMELLYIPYTPEKAEWLILQNRRIIGDQMDYLSKQIKNENSRVFEENL